MPSSPLLGQIRKSGPAFAERAPNSASVRARAPTTASAQHPVSVHTPLLDDPEPELEPEGEPDMMELQAPVFEETASNASPRPKAASPLKRLCMDYRVLEFAVAIGMMAVGGVFAVIPVHMREIPRIEVERADASLFYARDPSIDQKMMKQHVTMPILLALAVGIPIVTNVVMNYLLPRCKCAIVVAHDTRDFLLSLALAVGLSVMLTQFIKNMTGRFRPCFYDMCQWDFKTKWDGVTDLCQSGPWGQESRKSFPSGHASMSWSALFLLSIYLMGRARLNVENRSETFFRGGRKTLKLALCSMPTLLACWICVTRSVDNWHHYADIVAGSCLGAGCAVIGYCYNYGSIFSWEAAGVPFQEYHRQRKTHDVHFRTIEKKMSGMSPYHSSSGRHSGPSHVEVNIHE